MYKKIWLIAILSFFLGACSGLPKKPEYQLPIGAKIGVIANISNAAKFSSFRPCVACDLTSVDHTVDWHFQRHMLNHLSNELESKGRYTLIDLSKEDINAYLLSNAVSIFESKWIVSERAKEEALRLGEKYGVNAIVLIKEDTIVLDVACTSYGDCTTFRNTGYGVVWRKGDIVDTFRAVPGFRVDVILLEPFGNLALTSDYSAINGRNLIDMPGFVKPKKGEPLTEGNWNDVRSALVSYFESLARKIRIILENQPLPLEKPST